MIDLIFLPFISSLVFAQIHESFRSYSDRDHFLMDGFVYPKYYLTRKHNQVIKKSGENHCIGSRTSLDTTTITPHSFTVRNSLCMESTSHWKWTPDLMLLLVLKLSFQKDIQNIHTYLPFLLGSKLSSSLSRISWCIFSASAIDYWAEAEKTTIFTRFLIRMTQQQEVILCARMEEGKTEEIEIERERQDGM